MRVRVFVYQRENERERARDVHMPVGLCPWFLIVCSWACAFGWALQHWGRGGGSSSSSYNKRRVKDGQHWTRRNTAAACAFWWRERILCGSESE